MSHLFSTRRWYQKLVNLTLPLRIFTSFDEEAVFVSEIQTTIHSADLT
jgi:hypothetical protein